MAPAFPSEFRNRFRKPYLWHPIARKKEKKKKKKKNSNDNKENKILYIKNIL